MVSTGPGTPGGRAEPTARFATGTNRSGSSNSSSATAARSEASSRSTI